MNESQHFGVTILFLILGIFAGFAIGSSSARISLWRDAIDNGSAEYDSITGMKQWIPPVPANIEETDYGN